MRKLTGEPADMFGFVRRGYLREGYWADVCVFDPDDRRHRAHDARVRDFPADAERLTAEEPTGVRHVLVNGTPIRVDEAQVESLASLPGTRPRSADACSTTRSSRAWCGTGATAGTTAIST